MADELMKQREWWLPEAGVRKLEETGPDINFFIRWKHSKTPNV